MAKQRSCSLSKTDRVGASMLRRSGKLDVYDENSILTAFHSDRWKQCCVCAKWRFVGEDTARLLRSESLVRGLGQLDKEALAAAISSDVVRIVDEATARLFRTESFFGGSGQFDEEALAAAISSEVVCKVRNCVGSLQCTAERSQESLKFECCMLQRKPPSGDDRTTWPDCRCDEPDDFSEFLQSAVSSSELEEGDEVCLLPVDSSMVFHSPADFGADAALKKDQMALLGFVRSVLLRKRARPPYFVLRLTLRCRGSTVDVKLERSDCSVGSILLRPKAARGTRKNRKAGRFDRAGLAKKYSIVSPKMMTRRVLKCAVRLGEHS